MINRDEDIDLFYHPGISSTHKRKKKLVICAYHAQIQQALYELQLCMQRTDENAGKDAVRILREAQKAVVAATEAGQSMEDRLKQYRNAIEDLGFIRKKKS